MALYKSYHPDVEVTAEIVLLFVNSVRRGKEKRFAILEKHGIVNPKPGEWHNFQSFLTSLEEISRNVGDMNTFLLGSKGIEASALTLPPMNNLKEALSLLNVGYHMNYRLNGEITFDPETGKMIDVIGNFELIEFSDEERIAKMISSTPYGHDERGYIDAFVRSYSPNDAVYHEVKEDITRERKSEGADSTTYIIRW